MRKEYGKALRAMFAAGIKQAASHFKEVKVKSVYFWPGDRAFCWQPAGQLCCWIVLSPSKKDYDEFTVLIGWSKKGRFPELGMVPCADLPTLQRDEFAQEEYLTRLPYLWTKEDKWWIVKEFRPLLTMAEFQASLAPIPVPEAELVVAPVVEDAISKIKEFGLPYLEAVSRYVTEGSAEPGEAGTKQGDEELRTHDGVGDLPGIP